MQANSFSTPKYYIVTCAIALAALCFSTLSIAASLKSVVNRNQVSLNETVQLLVELDQQASTEALNTSVLLADFDVLGVNPQNNSSVTIINGQTTQRTSTKWVVTLAPKREGLLTIPAFTVAGAQSSPITITVKNDSTAGSQGTAPMSASVKISKNQAYPNEQLVLTIELSAASDVSNLNASQLEIQNADFELLSQNSFNRINNGIARQVIELKYLIFAKEPGQLTIPAQSYTGVKGGSRSFFGQRGKQVVARTRSINVEVLEKPTSINAWFPANEVDIKSNWSGDVNNVSVGTPITRTVTITATGQRAEAIPPIRTSPTSKDGFNSYQDQAQLNTEKTANGLLAKRIESEAIVPSIEGEIILPAVTVDWWDTTQARWQQATLPAETIVAKPGLSAPESQAAPAFRENESQSANTVQGNLRNQALFSKAWPWQTLSAFLALVCLGQWWLFNSRVKEETSNTSPESNNENEAKSWQALQSALQSAPKTGDATNVHGRLISWINSYTPERESTTLNEFINSTDSPELKSQLSNLLENLYGAKNKMDKPDISTDFITLAQLLKLERQERLRSTNARSRKNARNDKLAPLYPS